MICSMQNHALTSMYNIESQHVDVINVCQCYPRTPFKFLRPFDIPKTSRSPERRKAKNVAGAFAARSGWRERTATSIEPASHLGLPPRSLLIQHAARAAASPVASCPCPCKSSSTTRIRPPDRGSILYMYLLPKCCCKHCGCSFH